MKTQVEVQAPLTGIFAFPHGTRPGTCLHQILQELDFSDLDNMPNIVSRNLRAFSIRDFDEVVCEMIRKTVSVLLEIGQARLHAFPDCARRRGCRRWNSCFP